MHLFTRTRAVDPAHAGEACTQAVDMSRYASGITGLDVVPWATVYGRPSHAVSCTARVESQAAMADALAVLDADPGYQARIADARRSGSGPAEDTIGEVVDVAGSGGWNGTLAAVATAQCAPGRIAEAMAWAVDVLSHHSKVTGLDGVLVRRLYGPSTTLVWISLAGSWDDIDASTAALSADATYLERIDDAGPLFLPGSAEQHLLRRLDRARMADLPKR